MSQSEGDVKTPESAESSIADGKLLTRLSLNSIPSIDRSDDESPSSNSNDQPNLAHTPPPEDIVPHTQPILAHTPPPHDDIRSSQPVPNLAHTPPPPPAPQTAAEALAESSHRSSPRVLDESPGDTYATIPGSSDPSTPDPRRPPFPIGYKRSSLDAGNPEPMGYGVLGSSPPSLNGAYGAIGGLYNSSHPSSGIYSGSASLGSIYGNSGPPPPIPPPPLDAGIIESHHRREHSFNSLHSVNSLREYYDKGLNRCISTSPKLSNRDIEINKMSNIYGGSIAGDYTGLTEMLSDPVEEEGGERVVWEYHNVQLTRVPTYGFGIAVSGGRDNPHFRNGDPSVAISEVLKAGPAEGKLEVNDRLISANGISLENVDYARAVQILRDSGQTVHLVVKRRIVLPATPEPQTLKVTLTKNKKKDDFGIVLGCRIYVKEILNRTIADKDGGLLEGDVLLKINNTATDNLSLKEAKKLLDGTKEKLQLLVRRENPGGFSPHMSPELNTKDGRSPDFSDTRPNYSTQNLYVQPPTRGGSDVMKNIPFHELEAKNNLRRPEPRFVSFKKEGSVGIRLTGGNEVGIFVTAVQPKSPAQLQGLIPGDKILKVNDMDMNGVTREEAVLYLMSLQDQIDLIVQTRVSDYQHILSSQKGDLFYIRTHFHYDPSGKSELSFRSGDIFRVVDTLHNGVVGGWQVYRIGRNNQETQKGTIPNKARAEELATAQFNAAKKEQTQSESRSGFFKRRRNSRRSKSLGKDHWEDVVFADSVSKFPAYERVTLRHPGFVRPVVLFGPLADLAREKLLKENAEKFASPQLDSSGEKPSGIIRLSAIREILERGKHAVLDITPNAVDRLNYAQFYPIVIFLRAESKQVVKELRTGVPKGRMSSKKLFDQSVKLEKLWSHVFTATISLTQPDMWYRKVKETIDKQQVGPIWMSEAKPSEALTDDFLFPMTSRLSYASSPESDLETGPESRTPSKSPHRMGPPHISHGGEKDSRSGRLVKSSSDPSIAAQEEGNGPSSQGGPPPYTASPSRTSPYEVTGIPIGPNAHDDLKSRLHPRSPQDHYRYNRSSSQPPQYHSDDPYRQDFKPMPPPKTSGNYKPVPPPKPKHYRGGGPEGGGSAAAGQGGWGYSDNVRKGYDRGSYHTNSNGGLSDDYSGIDSGQGSSLDRKYETLGRSSYSKATGPSSGRSGGYYLNVPPPRDNNAHHQQPNANPRGDLPNHDYRGSAFELYKKPTDPRNPLMGPYGVQMMPQHGLPNQMPPYLDQGSRCSSMGEDNNHHKVIATARGVFDQTGGTLSSEETGVSIVIPPGALGRKQEIYFKVCQDSNLLPPLDQEKGETLLSPLVMCGPHGLKFNKPVELRLPHSASNSTNTWSFALKSTTDSPHGRNSDGGRPTQQWTNVDLAEGETSAAKISHNSVSVLVDHF